MECEQLSPLDEDVLRGGLTCVVGRPTALTVRIDALPPSVNILYERNPFGGPPRLSAAGRAFRNRCTDIVRSVLAARAFQPLPQKVGWRVVVLVQLRQIETKKWKHTGDGERFVLRDVDGFLKILVDGIYGALGIDDKAVIDIHTRKCSGDGVDRVDVLLEEIVMQDEAPNATEISQIINARKTGVRASARDHPLVLQDLYSRAPYPGEIRHTVFDAWRWEIMSRLYPIFADVQAHITCPARSGRADACFECTDFMVINCMANTARLRIRRADGAVHEEPLLNLEECKQERHLRAVERPVKEEGKMTEEKGTTLPQLVTDVLRRLLYAMDGNEAELKNALNAIYYILAERRDEVDDREFGVVAEQQFAKIAAILHDLAENNFRLPHNILYYQEMRMDKLPERLVEDIRQRKGIIPYCISLYNRVGDLYRKRTTVAKASPGAPAKAEEPQPTAEETQPDKPRRRRRKGEHKETAPSSVPEAVAEAAEAAAANQESEDPRQLRLPGINGNSAPDDGPKVQEFARCAAKPEEEPPKSNTLEERVTLLEQKVAKVVNNMTILQRNFVKLYEQVKRG